MDGKRLRNLVKNEASNVLNANKNNLIRSTNQVVIRDIKPLNRVQELRKNIESQSLLRPMSNKPVRMSPGVVFYGNKERVNEMKQAV